MKLVCKARGEVFNELQLNFEVVDLRHCLRDVFPILLWRAEIRSSINKQVEARSARASVASMADQRSEISSQTRRKRVNSVFSQLRVWQERHIKIGNCPMYCFGPGPNPGLESGSAQSSSGAFQPDGKPGYLMQEKSADYSRGFLSQRHRLTVLLSCDLGRFFRDVCSPSSGNPGEHSNNHGHDANRRSRYRPPSRPERRALDVHRKALTKSQSHPVVLPVVLEPILP
ncbi:TPA: hypothetical protein ACG5JQ_000368 [Stenotrophomonas maltophilia]|uniref:hypothetical protein n=1 Tax=Stenotrophomonas maltophilia TaxID=40324 RepID=UPI0013D952B4|nr:hypothetical protein [Stenotrophomonas maltophilia]HDX0925486.1 hypothetical protein [Stenotrophomonas maltophilia]HDX0929156.1 hypothetical protein [Stenotrophomonas maltophilia]